VTCGLHPDGSVKISTVGSYDYVPETSGCTEGGEFLLRSWFLKLF
jgi:hypothetical protein